MKQALALSQAALNLAAKDPKNRPEMRGWIAKAKQLRERTERIGIALGEVDA